MSFAALETYLSPFKDIFNEEGVNELMINKPGEVWVEKAGDLRMEYFPTIDIDHLLGLGRLIAQSTDQIISEERPLLSATIPNGYRVQIVFPPACESGSVALSIRKGSSRYISLDEYARMGAFNNTVFAEEADVNTIALLDYLKAKQYKEFIHYAVIFKKNIIISGGTSTGKTTFANAALGEIPNYERLITVEDAREQCYPTIIIDCIFLLQRVVRDGQKLRPRI